MKKVKKGIFLHNLINTWPHSWKLFFFILYTILTNQNQHGCFRQNCVAPMSLSFEHQMLELFTQCLLTLTSNLMFIRNLNKSVLLYFFIIPYNSIFKLYSSFKITNELFRFLLQGKMMPISVYVGYYYESTRVHRIDNENIRETISKSAFCKVLVVFNYIIEILAIVLFIG